MEPPSFLCKFSDFPLQTRDLDIISGWHEQSDLCWEEYLFCEQHVVRKLFTIPGKLVLSTRHSMIVPLEFINWFPDSVPAKYMLKIIFSTFSFLHLIMHSARNITNAAPRAPASKMKIPMTFSRARASMPVPRHPLSEGQELRWINIRNIHTSGGLTLYLDQMLLITPDSIIFFKL